MTIEKDFVNEHGANQVECVNFVVGGDHRKGIFVCLGKLLVRWKNKSTKQTVQLLLGKIDSPKDNGPILQNTISSKIADSIKQLKQQNNVLIVKQANGSIDLITDGTATTRNDMQLLRRVPMRILSLVT